MPKIQKVTDPVDLAYAAGIIDGEGYICIYKRKGIRYRQGYTHDMYVRVNMCDDIVPSWLHTTFGGTLRTYPGERVGYRPHFIWIVSSRQAREFLKQILPYLKLKREQACVAIEFQDKKKEKGSNPKSDAELQTEKIAMDSLHELHKLYNGRAANND